MFGPNLKKDKFEFTDEYIQNEVEFFGYYPALPLINPENLELEFRRSVSYP
jgi:hypothetical protein